MPLFQEVWKIVGHDLKATSFTAKVDQVAETIFAAYSYQGKATGSRVSEAALSNYIIMLMGSLVGCLSALSSCAKASLYQQHRCL